MKDTDSERKKRNKRAVAENCFEWAEALFTSIAIVVVLFTFLFRIVNVSGSSMLPTLHSGDRVLLLEGYDQPKQGDVVVIMHTEALREPIIKRVIAVEDQTVDIDFRRGTVSVDGKELDESAYIKNGITTQPSDFHFPLVVPKGCVFVLGDNRPVSNDSRSSDVGMVDRRNILGKAEWIIYPFPRFERVAK